MVRYKLIDNNTIGGLVDQQFAKNVDTGHVETIEDIFQGED